MHQPLQSGSGARSSTINLPFVDDFSYQGVYPDGNKWMDKDVFINRTYPVNPITVGVATFDGLDEHGVPYDTINFFSQGGADTLTSQPIDLSSSQISDSIYFSFFYQPQGRGDQPNLTSVTSAGDSLVLEFKNNSGLWVLQWSHDGEALHEFKQVLIPLKSNTFLNADFQFRFRNYATLSGNNDHWHLDYVRLDNGRNMNDTTINDVSAVYNGPSLLKNFQAMPWNQYVTFESTEASTQHQILVRNNFNVPKNFNHEFEAFDANVPGTILGSSVSSSFNFNPLTEQFLVYNAFNFSGVTPVNNEVDIVTKYTYNVTADINTANDTLIHHQYFQNFEAYDDGTAELAYGVLGVGAKLALEYHLNVADTLQAIAIHFAHLNANVSSKLFSIMVWHSLSPDSVLYEQDFLRPTYVDTLNGFYYYRLSSPLFLQPGTFYIGWLQTYQDMLNVGFDQNDNSSSHLFYNVNGTWTASSLPGSVMIRPLLGNPIPFGVSSPIINNNPTLSIFPNPGSEQIHIMGNLNEGPYFTVFNIYGIKVLEGVISNSMIDIHSLAEGIYFVQLSELKNSTKKILKFIKQ